MRFNKLTQVAAGLAMLTGAGAAMAAPSGFALTSDQRLVAFRIDGATLFETHRGNVGPFAGADTALIGIDFRVQDGNLYGVGDAGGIYSINLRTGALTFVSQLTTVPDNAATSFGVDFNPAANRLRIVSDTGQNLRADITTGATTVDGTLAYLATTPPAPPAPTPSIVAAAYTNNDLDSTTSTTLFNLDSGTNQVVLQAPPNAGTLLPTGALGVDASAVAGFDIRSRIGGNGTTINAAYAVLEVTGVKSLYSINLLDGSALPIADFVGDVVDISFPTAP